MPGEKFYNPTLIGHAYPFLKLLTYLVLLTTHACITLVLICGFFFSQKEDEYPCHSSHSSEELKVHESVPVPKRDSHKFEATAFSCLVKVNFSLSFV